MATVSKADTSKGLPAYLSAGNTTTKPKTKPKSFFYPSPLRFNIKSLFILCLAIITSNATPALCKQTEPALPPTALADYKARYTSTVQGIKFTTERELKALAGQQYLLSNNLSHWFLDVTESSQFILQQEHHILEIKPLSYRYKRKGIGKNKTIRLDTSEDKQSLNETHNDSKSTLTPIPDSLQDKLSYQLQLRLDLMRLGKQFREQSYTYYERGKLRQYTFKYLGEETLKTDQGHYQTTKLQRIRAGDSKRSTTIWLATQLDYFIIKIKQTEGDNKQYQMVLKDATVAGSPLPVK
jgi:hypothetical protein